MKWGKFLTLEISNPDINFNSILRFSISSNPEIERKVLKRVVSKKVEFITFRPFTSLNLQSKNILITSNQNPRFGFHPNLPCQTWKSVKYTIYFHIEGEKFAQRLRSVTDDPEMGEPTIQLVIDHLTEWHKECWEKKGKNIVWDLIMKTSTQGGCCNGLTNMKIEIYRF